MATISMPGGLNDHAMAIVMKELVRRAISKIHAKRLSFEVMEKPGYEPGTADVFTDADTMAQRIYEKSLSECFPDYGIIAEEQGLRRDCTLPIVNAYFTVDPLDGTKAFIRRQSHGVGTMISLTINGTIVGAYVGDVNTREIYGCRAGSPDVYRLTEDEQAQRLTIDPERTLASQHLLLRDPVAKYSPAARALIEGGTFKEHEIGGGSIGIAFARLWKAEVGAMLLRPRHETPWDLNPVLGISQRLGFRFFEVGADGKLRELALEPLIEVIEVKRETLVAHKSRLKELDILKE